MLGEHTKPYGQTGGLRADGGVSAAATDSSFRAPIQELGNPTDVFSSAPTDSGTPRISAYRSPFSSKGSEQRSPVTEVAAVSAEQRERHEKRKSEEGCVVRALASALGVEPTDAEWSQRFEQMDKNRAAVKEAEQLATTPEARTHLTNLAIAADEENINRLVTDYAKNNSALGKALNTVDITSHGTLPTDEIAHLIDQGHKVLLTGRVIQDGEIVGRHMVHVGVAKKDEYYKRDGEFITDRQGEKIKAVTKGELVALSDGGQPLRLSQFGEYNTVTVEQKQDPNAPSRLAISLERKTPGTLRGDNLIYPSA